MVRGFQWLILALLSLIMACQEQGEEKNVKAASPPNILFIFADDWGYGDLGCYGNTEVATPNIDQLAMEGTLFTQFHVTSGVCSPSRTSVITGHFPAQHRVHGHFAGNDKNAQRDMPNWLNEKLPVYLPRALQKAGYVTAHFGKWHLGGGGLPHGDPTAPEPKEYGYDETRVWNGNGPTWKGDQRWPTTRYMDNDTLWVQNSSKLAVDATIDFLKRHQKNDQPTFVNLWLKDPHTPLWPTEEQRNPYKELEPSKETYYAVLTDADFHVGRLLASLGNLGLDENTLVIFSSDNGPAAYGPALKAGSTAGLRGRKTSIFQGGVDVPFIMRWPGKIEAGKIDSISVLSTVDLLPTFSALAKADLPGDYEGDGESFAVLFDQKAFKRSKPLFWEWRFSNDQHLRVESWGALAVRSEGWKLVANQDRTRVELFDISKDPFERTNKAIEQPEKTKELLAMWDNWKAKLP